MEHPAFSEYALELIAHRFKLLAEPMRLRLLQILLAGELSVKDLVEKTGANQANISKHLGILLDGGVISRRKAGTVVFYRITDPSILTLCDIVCRSLAERYEEARLTLRNEEEG